MKTKIHVRISTICPVCNAVKRCDIGADPLVPGRVTEIMRTHRTPFKRCPGSGQDSNPVRTVEEEEDE